MSVAISKKDKKGNIDLMFKTHLLALEALHVHGSGRFGFGLGNRGAELFDQIRNAQASVRIGQLLQQVDGRFLPTPASGELPEIAR